MVLRRFIQVRNLIFMRNYCHNNKKDICEPNTYCRHGDAGETPTLCGEIHPKDHAIFHAMGVTEELLCFLGVAREHAKEANHEYIDKLKRIQTVIIEIYTAISKCAEDNKHHITDLHIQELEEWTKMYAKELPPPEKFIIPGSGITSASLQLTRTICRKTERYIVPFVRNGQLNQEIQIYLNRLDDFLFMLSRIAAKMDKQNELIYIPSKMQDQKKPS